MGNGDNGEGIDDIFAGDVQPVNPNNRLAKGPSTPTLTLDNTIDQEDTFIETQIDSMQDITGGYSPQAHQDVLDKVRNQRRARQQLEEKAEEYWKNNDKAISAAMGISHGSIMTLIYNTLGHVGVNLYKRDAQKAMGTLRSQISRVQSDVDKLQTRLEGKVQYIPPVSGESVDEALKQRKYVREMDKGLRYKLSEATDEARMLGYQYRNGIRALEGYRTKLSEIDEDISKLQNSKAKTASAQISKLQTEKAHQMREKEALEIKQREYEIELKNYEKKIDRLQAKSSFYDLIIRNGNTKISNMESYIDILDDYIKEGDEMRSVHDLLNDFRKLDESAEKVNVTIQVCDDIADDQLEQYKKVSEIYDSPNDRPLIHKVHEMTKQDQIASKKDMGRILDKLGIQV
jgi:hypothetical protein